MTTKTYVRSYGMPLALVFALSCAMLAATFFLLETRPAHAQTVTFTTQMDIGSSNSQVYSLQQFLASNSFIYPQGLVTGYYGPLTAAAVTQFQIAYGLPPVGRVGPLTLDKLNTVEASGHGLDVSAPIIQNQSVEAVSSNSATIAWSTNEVANGSVFYSTSPLSTTEASASFTAPYISGTEVTSSTSGTSQSVILQNLVPGTIYYYMIESTDLSGNVSVTWPQSSFTTSQ